jgi:hypothetical protein
LWEGAQAEACATEAGAGSGDAFIHRVVK